jgi:type II secretory pathway pseudopilin PulG
VYFPRRLEWKRYLRPYRIERRQVHDRAKEKNSSGTTLIEMFIVVAILGILTTSLLSVWTYTIRTQKGLGERAQIAEILSSEMNMLMTTSQVPAPSSDLQALPLPFSDFGNSLKLTGGYTVTETEQAALVQITVTLTHDLGEPASRYFRMVGYRWKER